MKTTLNLPDALLEAIKERAKSQGRTQTSVIEEALRKFLAAPVAPDERPPMPTFGVAGNDSLLEMRWCCVML